MLTTASCGLMYGRLNTTKTTNLGNIAKWLYEKFGLTSRLITADNEFDTLKDLIEAGVIEHFSIKAIPKPFTTLDKLSQGDWPGFDSGRMIMMHTPPERMARIGAYLIEGTTTIAELLHADHINKGRKLGEDVVGRFSETIETEDGIETIEYAKSAMSHYQSVQDRICFNLIPNFNTLPVKWVWWTGHEYAGEDEATGATKLGVGTVGKAAVVRVPRVVGNCFHMTTAETLAPNKSKVLERRAYFEEHADDFMKMQKWPAGVKIPIVHLASFQKLFPGGYIPLTPEKGIEQYLAFHHEINKARKALVIVPGTEAYPDLNFAPKEYLPALTSPQVQNVTPPTVSQTAPPLRPGFRRPPAPQLPPRSAPGTYGAPGVRMGLPSPGPVAVPPKPTLEEKLVQSIEKVTGEPFVLPEQSNTLPDINEVPASQQTKPIGE